MGESLGMNDRFRALGFCFVIRRQGLQHDGQFGIFAPRGFREPDARAMIGFPFAREVDIGNDAQDVFLVGLEIVPGFLIGAGRAESWAAPPF